jgi:4-amino-4-deoxy-L-arabinose transferase-like glycosyltransferase
MIYDQLRQRPKLTVSLIFLTAVFARIAFVYLATGFSTGKLNVTTLDGDEKGYVMLAENIAEGKEYGSDAGVWGKMWRTPAYPIFISSIFLLAHNLPIVQVFQALLGGLVCILIYLIGTKVFDSTLGALAALYFAFYPPHVYMSGQILSENLFLPLLLLTVLAFLRMAKSLSLWQGTVCGALLGITTLTRPESAGIVIVIIAITSAIVATEVKQKICLGAVTLLGMTLVLAPWLIRNYQISGRLVLSTVGGEAFWGGNNEYTLNDPKWRGYWKPVNEIRDEFKSVMEGETDIERDRRRWYFGLKFLNHHKSDIPRLAYYKLRRFYSFMLKDRLERIVMILSFGLLTPFMAAGFIGSLINFVRTRYYGLILHVIVVYYNVLAVVFYGSTRFRLAVDPFLIMFGIYALRKSITYFLATDVDKVVGKS